MKEVDYTSKKYEILDEGDYKGKHYVITYMGKYPCAYVEFNDEFERDSKMWENVSCHWDANYLDIGPWTYPQHKINNDPRIYIGWDYGHVNDYTRFDDDINLKKWTVKEIREDVKKVIDYLNKIKNKLLTYKEKTYLENVLIPFKDRIIDIRKREVGLYWAEINIRLKSIINEKLYDYISLPVFEKDKYYKNLVNNQPYTKEDLELFEE